jgi:DNA-binding GntR family transcriptional regulator
MSAKHVTKSGKPESASGQKSKRALMSKAESRVRAEAIAKRLVADQHDRPSLVSKIACEVAAEIVESLRHPDDDLNSVELARRYKTSRTPIREALMLLEKEGLVEMPPRRRPRVTDLTIKEIRDIYKVRANLLELIAADIARDASPSEIETLEPMLGAMEEASELGDVGAFFWANVDFHERNTELGGNPTVKKIIDSLLLRTLRVRRIGLSQPGRLRQSFEDHERLYRAYQNRDSNLAAALIRSNHMSGLAVLESIYLSRAQSDAPRGTKHKVST